MKIKNFLFHRVSDDVDELWPPMKPALFERIIRSLTSTYHVVLLEDYLAQGSPRSSQQLATVLFDDGYKDNIEFAAPILQKYKCPASFYVVTDCINRNIPTWTYLLDHALQRSTTGKLELKNGSSVSKTVQLADHGSVKKIKPWMKKLPNRERMRVLDNILQQCTVEEPQNKMMSWSDVRELNNAGFYIGSHSHTHPMLAALESEDEIAVELNTSANIIGAQLGKKPLSISYPIGSFDRRVITIARETGYHFGLAVDQRFFHTRIDDVMAIPRVELYQEPIWKTRLRMMGAYQKVRQLWR